MDKTIIIKNMKIIILTTILFLTTSVSFGVENNVEEDRSEGAPAIITTEKPSEVVLSEKEMDKKYQEYLAEQERINNIGYEDLDNSIIEEDIIGNNNINKNTDLKYTLEDEDEYGYEYYLIYILIIFSLFLSIVALVKSSRR